MIRLWDLQAAEAGVDKALRELRDYSENPSAWAAHERLDERDLKTLVLHKGHFERLEVLQRNVEHSVRRLQATQQAFATPRGF